MREQFLISSQPDQLREGLFGQIFLWIFEILPYLKQEDIYPDWAIRSPLYGAPDSQIVIPGLLELNYHPEAKPFREINLCTLREAQAKIIGGDWTYASDLWKAYFRWPERVRSRAAEFPALDHALGIHYRGTDKNTATVETNFVSMDDFATLVEDFISQHPDITRLYVATDEPSFSTRIRAAYPHLEIIYSGDVQHHKSGGTDTKKWGKGDHALLDCLLLSQCRYLLKCQSALSGFAKILNPNLEAYRVSAFKLAYWSWGIPYFPDAYLPKLASSRPECQKILDRLFVDDWTTDPVAVRKYGRTFQFKARKRYMRKNGESPRWSVDGLQQRLDARWESLERRFRKVGAQSQ